MTRTACDRRIGPAVRRAIATLAVAGIVAVVASLAADARQLQTRPSPLASIAGLNATQVTALQRSGIRSISALGSASPATLTRTLGIELAAATRLVERAKGETARLNLVYANARAKFPFSRALGGSPRATPEEAYAQLIAPTNECTILVRKVCGLTNQCASALGCPLAKQILDTYNTDIDKTSTAEACVISLEDSIIFPQCPNP